jgi:phosphate transport system substrate-binding protein
MTVRVRLAFAVVSLIALAACSGGAGSGSRDYVQIVGSSTVYPFAAAVAEVTAKATGGKSAHVEATGTGAGIKLFCGGLGARHPDITNASRRMKKSEYAECAKHGVTEIVEIQVGLDGIAFAESQAGLRMNLTPVDLYKALAANPYGRPNTAKTWADVNPALPAEPILIYGPPATSGTRDALAELILTKGCEADPAIKAMANKAAVLKICTELREDGSYADAGENDNLIVQKIAENPKAIGIFGYSFLEENPARLKGITISGVAPSYATISDFSYPGARPLYIYVKAAHLNAIRGLKAYVGEWAKAWGPDGYLKAKGMVIAPDAVQAKSADIAAKFTLLDPASLK